MKRLLCAFATFQILALSSAQDMPPSCSSPVYCHGDLLHTVQKNQIFADSKTFVDMKMRFAVNQTLSNFQQMMENANQNPSKADVRRFVGENFEEGNELEQWTPEDYKEDPKFLDKIQNPDWKLFATELVKIWPSLARRVKPDVLENPDQYSLIPVNNGFIVPGGRFREFYYWDTYWIMKGLLLCEMTTTVRGMLDNFLSMVDRFGFVPNGGRVYYSERTQPPLLTPMAMNYYVKTKDNAWLSTNIATLDKELTYFLENRTIEVVSNNVKYLLARYNAVSSGPRPESYYEDLKTAEAFDEPKKTEIYINLKSGAESGWDFSSRWFFDAAGNTKTNISNINTTRLIPVDLNAFLCGAFDDLSNLYNYLGDSQKTQFWNEKKMQWMAAIEGVLWNEEHGVWFDWDRQLERHRTYFYASNVSPLWTRCLPANDLPVKGAKVLRYLQETDALNFTGGTPTSLDNSGEQWDYPNAWPPLQAIIIQALENTGVPEAVSTAKDLADLWITSNRIGFNETEDMFEKYDSLNPGKYGGGGEYTVQSGFGWTNGVVLELIDHYSP